jgi:hypothetical protein
MFSLKIIKDIFITSAFVPYRNGLKEDELTMVFDPGCAITLIDTSTMDMLGYSARRDVIRTSSLSGAVGESQGYVIKLPFFTCIEQTLTNFEIACHDLHSSLGVTGLLGMNFFKHFRMDIDFNSGVIHSIENIL